MMLVTCGTWRHGASEKLVHVATSECSDPQSADAPLPEDEGAEKLEAEILREGREHPLEPARARRLTMRIVDLIARTKTPEERAGIVEKLMKAREKLREGGGGA